MAKPKNYTEAVKELDEILRSLEDTDEVNMDIITDKVKRAAELIRFCKTKLHQLDKQIEEAISGAGSED